MTLLSSAATPAAPAKGWSKIELRRLLLTVGGMAIAVAAVEMLAHVSWPKINAAPPNAEHVMPDRN
jgi:hypothetical protein